MSVSFGSQALFRWKGKSCLDGDASSCYFGHGDILVMDGQCQDEFLHRTDPGLEQERINVTFRWIRQHTTSCPLRAGVVCYLPTCAKGLSASYFPQGLGYGRVPFAGLAFLTKVGGRIIYVTLGEFPGSHKRCLSVSMVGL